MKFQDVPDRLGFTQKQIADAVGTSKQNLGQYLRRGTRGNSLSTVVRDVCDAFDIDREEVFFRDAFDDPSTGEIHRHLNAAIECLEMAALAGADQEGAERLKKLIFEFGNQLL